MDTLTLSATQQVARNAETLAQFLATFPEEVEPPSHYHVDHLCPGPEINWLIFGDEGDQRSRAAAIVRGLGGKWDKRETGNHFRFVTERFGVRLEIVVDREQVCTARVVGQETVTKQVPTAFEVVTETVDVVEWDCRPLLPAVQP